MNNKQEDMLNKINSEFLQVESGAGWAAFFQGIRAELNNLPFESAEARKIHNKKLNRYQDVNPFDHSRIILKNSSIDYINASLVSVEKADRKYILAQGPLPHTTSHFWLMIWQNNSRAIIMLNRIIEKNMIKCHQYWPLQNEDSYIFNDVGLKVTFISEERASYYTVTKLKLENLATETNREVVHFHYTTWPDFGCPQSPTAFLKFLALVRSSGVLDNSDQAPVVHCSAGIGRSGTFCLVDSCLRLIKDMDLDNVVVRDVLVQMRHYRMGLVQTPDQLRFSYLAILEGLKTSSNGTLATDCGDEAEEEEEEEEAPPLPPPRSESLHQRVPEVEKRADVAEDLRQRRKDRDEKQEKLVNRIKEVKDKIKDAENWTVIKRNLLGPAGLAALILTGGSILYWLYRD